MEIIKIGSNSFKISLTAKEAAEYDFSSNTESSEIKKSLKDLLQTIKGKDGFDLGTDKVSAEIYMSKDGACDVFVSKTQAVKQPSRSGGKPNVKTVHRFESLEELLLVCKRLKSISYAKEAYIHYNRASGAYFLTLSGIYPKDLKYAFLSEYGTRLKSVAVPYISEHCECLCENNTIEIFSNLL